MMNRSKEKRVSEQIERIDSVISGSEQVEERIRYNIKDLRQISEVEWDEVCHVTETGLTNRNSG